MLGRFAGLFLGAGLAIIVVQPIATLGLWLHWRRAARRVR